MTMLISKIDSINNLVFNPLKSKPIRALKAVKQNGTTVILGADGEIYLNSIKSRVAYNFTNRSLSDALDACIKMRVLSDKAVAEHRSNEAAREVNQEAMHCAKYISEHAKILGVAFTKAQQKIIDKALGGNV